MTLRYDYNLPWRGVIAGTLFYAGLSALMFLWAKENTDIAYVGLIVLGVIFALLAIIVATRRILSPRELELTEDAILFPRGFARARITRISYEDIVRMKDNSRASRSEEHTSEL